VTRLTLGMLLAFALLMSGCSTTTHREFRGTPEDFAILQALPLPPDSATTEIKSGTPAEGLGNLALMDVSDKPVGPNPVSDAPTNPDDLFLYIYLNKPNEGPASGSCYMDHPNEPPVDDHLMVTMDGPGGAYKVVYPTHYKDANDRPGAEFRFYIRDLPPTPGRYTINVVLLNVEGSAHSFYTYCRPGYCGEFRRCERDCSWGWCKNQQFSVVRP